MHTRTLFSPGRIAVAALLMAALCFCAATAAAQTQPPPPPPLVDSLRYIQHITIGTPECAGCPPIVCPAKPVVVTVSGVLPDGCVAFRGLRELPVASPFPVIAADFVVDTCGRGCPEVITLFSGTVTLPPQPSGHYQLLLLEGVRACPDTTVTLRTAMRNLQYDVLPQCAVEPPTVDSLVRSFVSLRLLPERPCAGDTLTLQLVKNGCPPCVHLRSFGNGAAGNYNFEGVVDWTPLCAELRCQPETLSVSLGAHSQGAFLITPRIRVNVLGTDVPDSSITFMMRHEFSVGPCDTTTGPCIMPFMQSATSPFECAVTVEPGASGNVPLMYSSPVELGGLEGKLNVPAPFRVTNLGVASHLAGVHLSWVAERGGARWLVFTDPGVALPEGGRQHLLNATLTADRTAPRGATADMYAALTLASDPGGQEVPLCNVRFLVAPTVRLCVAGESSSCDVNQDGRLDVRDLVHMVRCMRFESADSTRQNQCPDCDHDNVFGLADVFCCAREVLRGPGIPRDSARVEALLHVSIDAPVPEASGDGLRLRVRLRGARTLDAVLLRLRYPADRWRLQPPVLADPAITEGWLPLGDASEAGLLRVGAIRLAEVAADELVYELQAIPLAGAASSGTLTVEGADFTAPDGALLTPLAALPSVVLGEGAPAGMIELSRAHPNPFTTGTTFSVLLPDEADVVLAVHDLAGRRVATLAQGRLGAGRRAFTWNGTGARDGIYFVKLSVDGRVLSTRVALLRDSR